MSRLLLLLPLAVSLFGQARYSSAFFDASTHCVPGPQTPDCAQPEEQLTFKAQPVAPSVSVYRLSHKVPGKALKAWQRAVAAAHSGSSPQTVAALDEALAQDGDFADALHMRGLFAYQDKDFQRAATMLNRAATLDSANPTFLADAAVSQLTIRNPVDAERYARAALRLNPEQARALQVLNRLKP